MAELHIALQEGFDGDEVIVLIDGQDVYRRPGVTTRTQIGLADSFTRKVADRRVAVEVRLPGRGASGLIDVDGNRPCHIGVSVTPAGRVALRAQDEPFGYL
jgi:hypothetical protein